MLAKHKLAKISLPGFLKCLLNMITPKIRPLDNNMQANKTLHAMDDWISKGINGRSIIDVMFRLKKKRTSGHGVNEAIVYFDCCLSR